MLSGLLLTSSVLTAQEASVGLDTVQADTQAIAMQMDAKNAAVLAVLQKLTTCNAAGAFYRPDAAGADPTTGCWSQASAGSMTPKIFSAGRRRNEMLAIPGSFDVCALTEQYGSKNYQLICKLSQPSPGAWQLYADDQWREGGQCSVVCFDLK